LCSWNSLQDEIPTKAFSGQVNQDSHGLSIPCNVNAWYVVVSG
jgi:hypothetical protein